MDQKTPHEPAGIQAVLDFWFAGDQVRMEWFQKNDAFDEEIRRRFGAVIESLLKGELADWAETPRGRLASILVLDQFTRNSFRNSPRAFAGDPQALALALRSLDGGDRFDSTLQRWFTLMPLEHAEDLALQQRCVREFEALAAEDPRLAGALDYARKHLDVIQRFGRFPHRNAALGRESTPAERDYLAQPGAGF